MAPDSHPLRGRTEFKATVADHVLPNVGTIPIDEAVVASLREAKENDRRVYLATATDRRVADAVDECVGGIDGDLASEQGVKLKGESEG